MMPRVPSKTILVLFLLLPVLAAISVVWSVWEQDIFWQVRAGNEILAGKGLQYTDAWSYTSVGKPWINIQWFGCIILSLIDKIAGLGSLIAFRMILAALFVGICGACATSRAVMDDKRSLYAVAFTVILAYVAVLFKFEIRTDTINFLIFGLLLYARPFFSAQPKWARTFFGFGAVVLAANIHAGTTPFIIVAAVGAELVDFYQAKTPSSLARICFACGLCAMGFFVTPYGWRSLPVLWEHLNYSSVNILDNYDHYPLRFDGRSIELFGAAAYAWTLYALLGWIGFIMCFRKFGRGSFSKISTVISFLIGAVFTWMAIDRMRAMPYHVMWFAPYVALSLEGFSDFLGKRLDKHQHHLALGTLFLVVLAGVAFNLKNYRNRFGFGAAWNTFPVGSVEFIRREKPKPEIWHGFAFGAYLVGVLPEYRTFVDTRETMFRDLQQIILDTRANPDENIKQCDRFGANTALMPVARTRMIEGLGYEDIIASFFPYENWAVVYFDDISVVHVRRIPEHEDLIKRNEFTMLKPHIPVHWYLGSTRRTAEKDERLRRDVKRCLANEPTNLTCAVAQSALWREVGTAASMGQARELMSSLWTKGRGNEYFRNEAEKVLP